MERTDSALFYTSNVTQCYRLPAPRAFSQCRLRKTRPFCLITARKFRQLRKVGRPHTAERRRCSVPPAPTALAAGWAIGAQSPFVGSPEEKRAAGSVGKRKESWYLLARWLPSESLRYADRHYTASGPPAAAVRHPICVPDSELLSKVFASSDRCIRCSVIIAVRTNKRSLKPQYGYVPHNDVSFNDGRHIRRWSHNIIILSTVLQLPTVFSTVTCCTGL